MRLTTCALLVLAACTPAQAEYRPTTAETFAPATREAVIVYEDDAAALDAAGGRRLGKILSSGTAYSSEDDLHRAAICEAARRGGTHALLVRQGVDSETIETRPEQYETTVSGQTATTTKRPARTTTIERPYAGYYVVRVPEDRWEELPEALRPRVGGKTSKACD